MSDYEEEPQRLQELLKAKAELQEANRSLSSKVQDETEKIKSALKDARLENKKLLHHHEKLKYHAGKHFYREYDGDTAKYELKKDEKTSDNVMVNHPKTTSRKEEGTTPGCEESLVLVRRHLNALKIENAALIGEKRKTEEHNQSLVQELAELGMKYEHLQALFESLSDDYSRLKESPGAINGQEEDSEMMKHRLRLNEENIEALQAQVEVLKRSKERQRAELDEARAIIKEQRQRKPFEIHPTPVYQLGTTGRYHTYEDHYGYSPHGYLIVRPELKACTRQDQRKGQEMMRKFKPDMSAVTDEVGKDTSRLDSSRSL